MKISMDTEPTKPTNERSKDEFLDSEVNPILEILKNSGYALDHSGIFMSGLSGYWSNLSKAQNQKLLEALEHSTPEIAVKTVIPQYYDMIFSEKREAALELLDHSNPGICIDFGCMWGVMSFGMAKRGHTVLAVDQTYESLRFIRSRSEHEGALRVYPIHTDIRKMALEDVADYAIVNGVLEWIPTSGEVVVDEYYKSNNGAKFKNCVSSVDPHLMQVDFIKRVHSTLKDGGQMLLAIECRHSYEYYLGKRDPHVNLLFTTFLPRSISSLISLIFKGKPYVNYIYSFKNTVALIKQAGFSEVSVFAAFPNYHFPEMILPYSSKGFNLYNKYANTRRVTIKQKLAYYFEYILMRFFRAKSLSPAIVLVAKK